MCARSVYLLAWHRYASVLLFLPRLELASLKTLAASGFCEIAAAIATQLRIVGTRGRTYESQRPCDVGPRRRLRRQTTLQP